MKLYAVALVSCVSMMDAWKWAVAFSLGISQLLDIFLSLRDTLPYRFQESLIAFPPKYGHKNLYETIVTGYFSHQH